MSAPWGGLTELKLPFAHSKYRFGDQYALLSFTCVGKRTDIKNESHEEVSQRGEGLTWVTMQDEQVLFRSAAPVVNGEKLDPPLMAWT